jgi:putative ubiquitin-RnfH superfamily antitoxin RatB of RatAB toxin-antitoxin module
MADEVRLRVTVAYSPAPREVLEWARALAPGATVLQALEASGLPSLEPRIDLRHADVSLWGRKADAQTGLRDGDRVEVLRPLKVDPKVARRERFRKQGTRTAGLFAGKPAGKPGRGKGQARP